MDGVGWVCAHSCFNKFYSWEIIAVLLYCFICLIESCFGLIDGLDLIMLAVIVAGMYYFQARPSSCFVKPCHCCDKWSFDGCIRYSVLTGQWPIESNEISWKALLIAYIGYQSTYILMAEEGIPAPEPSRRYLVVQSTTV